MTDLTLEERAEFEALLTEHANAWMDVMRATERRHKAMHAINDYVNTRTLRLVQIAKQPPPPAPPPFAMPSFPVCGVVPVVGPRVGCACKTCSQARETAARLNVPVGTTETDFGASIPTER